MNTTLLAAAPFVVAIVVALEVAIFRLAKRIERGGGA